MTKKRPQTSAVPGRLERPRLYVQLADHIARFIEAQGLSPGDRLPPERLLAAELGVSRASLSRALVALEVQGKVEVQHGNGAVVLAPTLEDEKPALSSLWAERDPADLARAREAVMSGLARSAAAHPDRSLRLALLDADGSPVRFSDTWPCVRRLSGPSLLAELDDLLAEVAPVDESQFVAHRLVALARAVVVGDEEAAASACAGLFRL
ncbi:FadR/GntR family transcriptional regulator [Nonomuraea diastatica]|uniref:FadR family transcriptional regulator n=1 Tax=Nonomuraea diastatica TaxID=1848329 RepID=A0A4R4WQC4_9ACTN|nr:FadR family transcriptional regulator [Nonomuraea diastatica]